MNDLSVDVNEYQKYEKQIDFSEFNKIQTTTDNYSRSWWYGFIRLLVTLPYPTDSCHKLVEFLQVYYEGKVAELSILSELEANYRSSQAIWWYTRPTFLFELLNKSLRQHNIKLMFLFGFFVQDLYRQLKIEFEAFKARYIEHEPILKSYRGQIMHRDEIKKLKIGDYIINNSFFSTSLNRHLALIFGNPSLKLDDQFQNILFQFEIDVRQQVSNPFADISSRSHFPEESEILFMMGCKFEIQDIYYDENENYWLVKMDLDYAYNPHVYQIYDHVFDTTIRRVLKYCLNELPNCIIEASIHDINILFDELTDLFPLEEKWISAIKLQCLGTQNREVSRCHTEAISYYKQALEIWNNYLEDNELNCLMDISEIHKIISVCYEDRYPTDKNLAMTHCDLAISYMTSAIEKAHTDYEKINTMNRLVNIYSCKMHISNNIRENAPMAIKYLEVSIQEMLKYYLENDNMIISRIVKLAGLFYSIAKYDDALIKYKNVLDIYLQQPKPSFNWINTISEKMANIYIKHKYDYNSGLQHQLINHEYTLKENILHRTDEINGINDKKNQIASSYNKLSVIYMKLGQYNLAYTNLIIAMKLHEEVLQSPDIRNTIHKLAKIKVILADISVKLRQYDLASEHLEDAVRLCEGRPQLYDENTKIAGIYVKLANGYAKLQQHDLMDQHLARALNIYRDYNDSQYELKTRVTTVVNGRIRRCKRSCTIIYVAKYERQQSYIIAFLDNKITTVSHSVIHNEIRRIYNHHR